MDKNVPGQAPRFDLNHETCFGKTNRGFIEGFFTEFRDSYRYTFLIQFILVSLLYFNVGKGVYWKVLFYASLAGLPVPYLKILPSPIYVEKICEWNNTPSSLPSFLSMKCFGLLVNTPFLTLT